MTCLNFKAVSIVDNLVTGLKTAVVKVLSQQIKFMNKKGDGFLTNLALIGTIIYIMCERTSSYTSSVVDSSHVIKDGVCSL